MIVVTGGLGFIGQNLIQALKKQGLNVVVLDIRVESLNSIYSWLIEHNNSISFIFHLGAITDTTVTSKNLLNKYNLDSSKYIWNFCTTFRIPLIYASSAATYGDGFLGFDDEITELVPLNLYGWSKQEFDVFAIESKTTPPFWVGLKFFNVYGFGEAHKGSMASVVYHFYNQINESGEIKLFKSHRDDIANGEQKRDFIYVDDVVDVCLFMFKEKPNSGIYNVGTGKARSYNDLAKEVFKSLGKPENISYVDIPESIRENYQYFTEAKMIKLRNSGYLQDFHQLEEGIFKYINKLKNENR